jgi:hypothetical protein
MPFHGKKFLLVFCLIVFFSGCLYSQSGQYLRLRSGGNVPFTINSFNRYKSGTELNDWTRFKVLIDETIPPGDWRLEVSASDPDIIGDYTNKLDLDYLRIKVEVFNEIPEGTINIDYPEYPGFTELIYGPKILLTGTGNVEFDLYISYSLGTDLDKTLLGQNPDYYFVNIYFDLKENN